MTDTNQISSRQWTGYALAAFLSAFLLFWLELMAAKTLLPRFGGSVMVWATCTVFFQFVLLLGYLFVHQTGRRRNRTAAGTGHVVLLGAAAVINGLAGNVYGQNLPAQAAVLVQLFMSYGAVFFMLATMNVALQQHVLARMPARAADSHTLYSASNAGSVAALLSYPTLIEPLLTLSRQQIAWWAAYAGLIVLSWLLVGGPSLPIVGRQVSGAAPVARRQAGRWLLLSAAASFAMLAVTNVLTFDVVPVPFLWVVPLVVYLTTFILVFRRRPWIPLWLAPAFDWTLVLGMSRYVLSLLRMALPPLVDIPLQATILFVVCMNCHARLAREKPSDAGQVTLYYCLISAGGLLGTCVVSFIMPLISTGLLEYPAMFLFSAMVLAKALPGRKIWQLRLGAELSVVVAAMAAILIAVPWGVGRAAITAAPVLTIGILLPLILLLRSLRRRPLLLAAALLTLLLCSQQMQAVTFGITVSKRLRNFYGIYAMYEKDGQRILQHGTTVHGRQYADVKKSALPLGYYHPDTPAGELLRALAGNVRHAAMVGLGAGALTMYFSAGQQVTIFELDPDGVRIAEKEFSYLRQARQRGVKIDIQVGDGRINLQKTADAAYGLLIIDAFNSGSIPTHLLTREAFREYLRVLTSDGMVLVHISNRVFDLAPVIGAAARQLDAAACVKSNEGDADADASRWLVLSRNRRLMEALIRNGWQAAGGNAAAWTDQYINFWQAIGSTAAKQEGSP